MLDVVATRVPRGPVTDVDGSLVRALRLEVGLSLMEFGGALGKEKATIQRWERGYVDEITWLGILTRLGKPSDHRPPDDLVTRAEGEVRELRAAAAKKPPKPRRS